MISTKGFVIVDLDLEIADAAGIRADTCLRLPDLIITRQNLVNVQTLELGNHSGSSQK
ncbi:MAG: hypothetical protein ACYC6W_11365 [Nitrosotalea sp.]